MKKEYEDKYCCHYEGKHYCSRTDKNTSFGEAVNVCFEKENGEIWVSNYEYHSQVNFCPYCGYEAKNKIKTKEILL